MGDIFRIDRCVGVVEYEMVKGDQLPIKWENHGTKPQGGDFLHGVHIDTSQKDVIIKLGIDAFNINHFDSPPRLMGMFRDNPLSWDVIPSHA